ncbi:MAG: hypothetical protein HN475_03740 [Piscirickettsiaceae bacterium]|jgi:hypothetical protein|nr:hypothetical protein [Piscirickettsiaceae bacterium]
MTDFNQKKIRTDADWLGAGNRERRGNERRDGADRREMIRFDLEQGDRRGYNDRRANANAWHNQN